MISAISIKDRLKNQAKEDGRNVQNEFATQKMSNCKKIIYIHIDKSFILAYNNGEKIEGGHHNEV